MSGWPGSLHASCTLSPSADSVSAAGGSGASVSSGSPAEARKYGSAPSARYAASDSGELSTSQLQSGSTSSSNHTNARRRGNDDGIVRARSAIQAALSPPTSHDAVSAIMNGFCG